MRELITYIRTKKQPTYNFKSKCTGIAGICPDCNSIVTWNSYHSRFQCLSSNCCFMANEKGERIWDNYMRDENLRKIEESEMVI